MENETLWDTVPDAPTLPLSDREELFVWGKERSFPEFHFDIKGIGGGIQQGEFYWKTMCTAALDWKVDWLTGQMWLEYAIKAIREVKQP